MFTVITVALRITSSFTQVTIAVHMTSAYNSYVPPGLENSHNEFELFDFQSIFLTKALHINTKLGCYSNLATFGRQCVTTISRFIVILFK
jgi:hypothetical protein